MSKYGEKTSPNRATVVQEREAKFARYQELAEMLRTKVMMLHQHRIRLLHAQLANVKAMFSRFFDACLAKLPAQSAALAPSSKSGQPHSKALSELLE